MPHSQEWLAESRLPLSRMSPVSFKSQLFLLFAIINTSSANRVKAQPKHVPQRVPTP